MSGDYAAKAVLTVGGERHEFAVMPRRAHEHALLEELSYVRREAQAEADLAYDGWRTHACRETYAVYRAAQDRADAAQDDLAEFVRRVALS